MVNELQARLHSLYNGRTPLREVGPQTAGLERYRVTATGSQLYTLLEAADRIGELEALLRELTDIEGPQPGHVTWYRKVQTALDRGDEPT